MSRRENTRSQASLGSDFALVGNVLSIKIKYFIVKTDHSCTLLLKEPNYQREQKHPMQIQLKQFYIPRNSSRRYAEEDIPHDVHSKISRNILSLDDLKPVPNHRR